MKKKRVFEILYNITCVIAWALLLFGMFAGFSGVQHLPAFYTSMAILFVDVILQIIFWNLF